jgi:hypothetical protein
MRRHCSIYPSQRLKACCLTPLVKAANSTWPLPHGVRMTLGFGSLTKPLISSTQLLPGGLSPSRNTYGWRLLRREPMRNQRSETADFNPLIGSRRDNRATRQTR